MTTLQWPADPPAADASSLRAELADLIDQVVNEQMRALDTLDDQFTRMAAALLMLLGSHEPDGHGRCPACGTANCDVLETIHQFLKQPLILVWWHQFRRRDEPMHIDSVAAWINQSQTPHWWDRTPSARIGQ